MNHSPSSEAIAQLLMKFRHFIEPGSSFKSEDLRSIT